MRAVIVGLGMALVAWAAQAAGPDGMRGAPVVILGEVHDNPHAHARQAELVAELQPAAIVFEMLTEAQAAAVTPERRADRAALEAALGWAEGGWPDFGMYHPIFTVAPGARIFGAAVPRDAAREAMGMGVASYFGADAALYGLDRPLDAAQQDARESFQFEAHCRALPEEMLPVMVDLQRLRDAALARAALRAYEATGGPVAVITGNGHARKDWGMPAYLERAAPGLGVFSLGIAEEGQAEGRFDALETVPRTEREDPCKAFEKG